jgi:hypothetical protein
MITLYRALVIISTTSYLLFIGIGYVDSSFLSKEELDILSWGGYGASIQMPAFLHWALVASWVPLAFGMYLFKPLARKLYLWLVIIFILANPFFGLFVATGYEYMLYHISTFLDGAILVMAYYTSISNEFSKA